jgi:hypothetical protein
MRQPLVLGGTENPTPSEPIAWDNPLFARSRRESRLQPVPTTAEPSSDGLFDGLLDWSFCQFSLNDKTLPSALATAQVASLLNHDILLFNVIVAIEWPADMAFLDGLRKAFERASNILYDVTDGYMAIGQVVVGGYELMDCADIQIFASNRLFPRSSVNGLNNAKKYQPIRLGRGLWNKLKRRTIAWEQGDQPGELGPQTLVHEWGHYALGLKDQYLILNRDFVIPSLSPVNNTIMADVTINELSGNGAPAADGGGQSLRLVQRRLSSKNGDNSILAPTILSTKQKTPTLLSRVVTTHRIKDNHEWQLLSQHPQFKSLQIPANHRPESNPPVIHPAPAFHDTPGALPLQLLWKGIGYRGAAISDEHCWIYVVKGPSLDSPASLIAQGSIEGSPTPDALPLLGANLGDFVVLIGNTVDRTTFTPLVLWAKITSKKSSDWKWQPATPDDAPLVDVRVLAIDQQAPPRYTIQVEVEGYGTEWKPWIFPLGRAIGSQATALGNLTALDGHVMLVSGDPTTRLQVAIANYSIGGSPGNSGYPVGPNPLPSGSTDGNAMLFFWDDDKERVDYSVIYPPAEPREVDLMYERYRIVTVTNLSNNAPLPQGYEPCSYAFSITSNETFAPLSALHPTLVLFYDNGIDGKRPQPAIGRYNPTSGSWELITEPKTTEADQNRKLVALSLNPKTAAGLFEETPKAEHFRLFVPQQARLANQAAPDPAEDELN